MLVLSRKSNQEIMIDGNIRVRVLSVAGGRVRLGIVAPREVQVVRSELTHADGSSVAEDTRARLPAGAA